MKSMKKQEKSVRILEDIVLLLIGLIVILPIYIAIVNTFKNSKLILNEPLSIPIPPTLENLISAFTSPNTDLPQMYGNSIFLMVLGTVFTIFVASMASYYLARHKSRFSRALRIYFLIGIMVPYVIVYLPLCILLRKLGIAFSVWVLVFVFVSGNISFATFMYTNFISSLPVELEEAAAIDGAGPLKTFVQIIFPLLKPCTATIAIFVGLGIWNDFQTPLLLGQIKTITVGIYTAVGPYSANWGIVFAYVLFAALPVIIVYLFAQKSFVNGLTAGALKG